MKLNRFALPPKTINSSSASSFLKIPNNRVMPATTGSISHPTIIGSAGSRGARSPSALNPPRIPEPMKMSGNAAKMKSFT